MSRVAAVGSEMPDCRARSDWDKPWQRTGRFDLSSGAVGSPEARAEIIDALFAVFDPRRLPEAHSRPSPFSSMNSTQADSSARRITSSVARHG